MRPTEEAYSEIQQAYDFYNERLFEKRLPDCLLTFQREKRTYGYFSADRFVNRAGLKTGELALNPAYFAVVPLIEVLQTIVHEMVHHYQQLFGKPGRRGYHNKEFEHLMVQRGLMPSDTGAPGGKTTGEKMGDYVIAGGRFEEVTKALLNGNFGISWFDRYPVKRENADRIGQQSLSAPDEDEQGDEEELGGSLYEEAFWAPASNSLDIEVRDDENRSNRWKYTCGGCGANVWGRPELEIGCRKCDLDMLAKPVGEGGSGPDGTGP